MRNVLLITIFAITLGFSEQSVYSDSDFIDTDVIAKKNSREIFILKQKLSQLKEVVEGLKSIINGQANEIERLRQKVEATSHLEKVINELSQRVATLESRPLSKENKSVEAPSKDIEIPPSPIKEEKKKEPKKEVKLSSKELYKEAVLNFTKSRLTKAQEQFKELLKRSYKKASVNFYLGEIAYKKKKYTDAISYYQQSAILNENASYMDKLLLHTAIALKKKGKNEDAKVFFKAVVEGYPDSRYAKEAKKYIK